MGTDDDLSREQLEQLAGVFRAEALEHIKGLAAALFALEDGSDDVSELLVRAFREAHSLKGSAGTLGFERVSVVTHRLEDLLGALRRGDHELTPEVLDLALETLDLVRRSAESSLPGDDELSDEEKKAISALERMLVGEGDRDAEEEPAQEPQPKEEPDPDREAAGERDKREPAAEEGSAGLRREEFIRVSEQRLDDVIGQVGELFESGIQLQSIGHEIDKVEAASARMVSEFAEMRAKLEKLGLGDEAAELIEQSHNLQFQLRGLAKKYRGEERILSKLVQRSQEGLRKIRLAPVSTIFVALRAQAREISRSVGKKVELSLSGGEYAVDRKVLEAVEEPIAHILRNAVDHGLEPSEKRRAAGKSETGRLSVAASHTGDSVELTISDDGRGIDPEGIRRALVEKRGLPEEQAAELTNEQLHDFLFESGFSTHLGVSEISGRGVGLDVVKHTVERLGGEVRLESVPGAGTSITLRLPLAMSTVRCLLVEVAGRPMAIPATNVEKVVVRRPDEIRVVGGGEVIDLEDQGVPLAPLADILGLEERIGRPGDSEVRIAALVRFGERRFAFGVDEVSEYAQLILKPLGDLLERVPNISGVSLLGTGELALVLNPGDLVRAAGGVSREKSRVALRDEGAAPGPPTILVADDSIATRTLQKTLLESAGYRVLLAEDGYEALQELGGREVDLVVTDIQMPNMDGLELTRTIKSRPALRHLPVVVVTALGSDSDMEAGMAAGADAYVVKKELTRAALVGAIEQLL